ncbi:phage integrase [Serratia marcescens]|uniref:phage integrase n=1 Tax=Serratia marcescens TaxID=615 RepID=UPI0013D9C556|nr:tyrosine-type recombinase/integrase [Serratia marcescens]
MSIKKLDDGRYLVDIRPYGVQGRRIRKIRNTKSEAQSYEKYVLTNYHNREWLNKPADKRLLSDMIDLWWVYSGRSQEHGGAYRSRLAKICREMGDPRIYQLTRKFLLQYRQMKLQAGLQASSVNRDLSALSSVFTTLIDAEEFHTENPVRALRKLKVKPTEMAFLSDDEISALLAQARGDEKRVTMLCLATGARWSEAANLKAEHIIGNRVTFVKTKNSRKRSIPVSDEIAESIKTKKSGALFKVNYLGFCRLLKEVKPDLPKGQATHVLRHTFATHFMMNGGNIVTLQRILGHATIQQTMTYAHFSPDHLHAATQCNPLKGVELDGAR